MSTRNVLVRKKFNNNVISQLTYPIPFVVTPIRKKMSTLKFTMLGVAMCKRNPLKHHSREPKYAHAKTKA